ncbi:uncharacterized protein LOC111574960 isoform X1 [Amphiprion ocellaris]|uniref:uncharacterized protein LOC111574960 isoform X1 n=1 Tax=Amphiprion ocellaris TaxID=80972 RepID=UPI002410F80B|nr:uncharacterized protein LOC111574960 isoform X1 [Amphiprion ocellaris]
MKTALFIVGLIFFCCESTERTTAEGQLDAGFVQSECRDRYLWIHVASGQTPRFEAVDGTEVHSIGEQLASRCGYTISIFKMDSYTTFRASYYSCFTQNQNDEVFTFRFNVLVSDRGGRWTSQSVSAVCPGLTWTHREIICEEDYMEVNVNRESSCGGHQGDGGKVWQEAFAQAQKTASLTWQLMFRRSDGQVSSMSVTEAQRWGYSLTTTAQRVVLRSPYKQPHAEVTMVAGVSVKVVQVSLFFKQKLVMVMIDMSMACTVNTGSFDGDRLLWDIPRVLTPLVGEGARFESRSFSLGVESVLLDEPTMTSRGFNMVQRGGMIQISVPFGAEGGYRKSLVVNNMYKEAYTIFLLYEHVFSLLYEDGSNIDTRHRMLRVLDTPLVCRPPFSLNQTVGGGKEFNVYLGNIPTDVILEDVWINGKRLPMSETSQQGFNISPVVHTNGSRSYELRLPFEDENVHWMYLGGGVVEYSIDINFTLTILPQRNSYYYHTFITARVFNRFPPEITAQCSDEGIFFSVAKPPHSHIIWEVGIDHEPLTQQLVAQRGYRLYNDSHRSTLEVPVFSVGYTYEEINLSNFYATFKLLLRDSKSLEVQTSTSKRCLFRTEDMIVCSADGTMTVVTTPSSTWPTVQPEKTTLLDPTCKPKETDRARALFEFKLDSCGTRAMVSEWYMVYENEILHDRLLMTDGPNFISRETQFKVTVRCFYPLGAVNRLSVDRIFKSAIPGLGSVKVFESHTDPTNKFTTKHCPDQSSARATNTPTNHVNPAPAAEEVLPHPGIMPPPKPGPSHFITVPGGHKKQLPLLNFPNPNLSPETQNHQVFQQVSSPLRHLMLWTEDRNVFSSPTDSHFHSSLPRYDLLPDSRAQLSHLNTPSVDFTKVKAETSRHSEGYLGLDLDSLGMHNEAPVVQQLGSSSQTPTPQGLNSLRDNFWHSALTWGLPTPGLNGIVKQSPESPVQSFTVQSSLSMPDLSQQHETHPTMSNYKSLGGRMEMANMRGRPLNLPQSQDEHQMHQFQPALQTPGRISYKLHLPSKDKNYDPAHTKHTTSKNHVPDSSGEPQLFVSGELTSTATSQVDQNLEKIGSIERRNVQPAVQNIRVKPLSKIVSSGPHLNQKPVAQKTNSQSSSPSSYTTSTKAVNNGGNPWTSQQLLGSNTREEHVLKRTGFLLPTQNQNHRDSVQDKWDWSDLPSNHQEHEQKLVSTSSKQQGHKKNLVLSPRCQQGREQKLVHPSQNQQGYDHVQSATETQNRGQESASFWRNIFPTAGASHIRVRPPSGLSGRLQTYDLSSLQNSQIPDSVSTGGTSRISFHSFTPQTIREYQTTEPSTLNVGGLKPSGGEARFTGPHTGPNGSKDLDSTLKIQSRFGCSGVSSQNGGSIHRGIFRGTNTTSTHTRSPYTTV